MAELSLNGARFSYDDVGTGAPAFLFVHGWGCDRSTWAAQLENLGRDHRCVAIDLRGRGGSDPAPPFGVEQAASDLAAVIEQLGLAPVIYVGHSLGGIVGLVLNEQRPELLRGLVTIDSPIEPETGKASPRTIERIREAGSMAPVAAFLESFDYDPPHPGSHDYVERVLKNCPSDVAAGQLEGLAAAGERMLDLIRAADRKPFMALWAEDALGDPAWIRDNTVFVRQEPVAGTGHFVHMEQPAVTNALLRAFLDDVERDPRV